MKSKSIFYKCLYLFFILFATKAVAQKDSYLYSGFSISNEFLVAKNYYNQDNDKLISKAKYSNNYLFNPRLNLELGYQFKDKHRFSFSMENLWTKTSYRFVIVDNFFVNQRKEINALNLKLNYSYKIYAFKKFAIRLGANVGLAIPENVNEENRATNIYYSRDSNGNLVNVLLWSVNDIEVKKIFATVGLSANFSYNIGARNELFFTSSLTHVPYLIGGLNVNYSLNGAATENFQSYSKVLNFGLGLGYNLKFVKRESKKSKSEKDKAQF